MEIYKIRRCVKKLTYTFTGKRKTITKKEQANMPALYIIYQIDYCIINFLLTTPLFVVISKK